MVLCLISFPSAFRFLTGDNHRIAFVSRWYKSHHAGAHRYNAISSDGIHSRSCISSYPADSIVRRIVSPRCCCTVNNRTSITSDNYARMYSSLFAKRFAQRRQCPDIRFFSFLNHQSTFSFLDAVPPSPRPLLPLESRQIGKCNGRWSHGSLTMDQWTFSRCPFP